MNKLLILLLLSTFGLSSCVVQFVTGDYYKDLKMSDQAKIRELDSFRTLENGYIYALTGQQLYEELAMHEQSLVYIFAPGCSSQYCYALKSIEEYADEKELKLFMVMSTYYNMHDATEQEVSSTLLSINANHYDGKGKNGKYKIGFEEEMQIRQYLKNHDHKYMGGYVFYKRHEVDTIVRDIFQYHP